MPEDVQVVFQGGGAKLCALIAAAQAVEEMEAAGEIKVRRVAGTSAGAITAVLYAARIPMSLTRERLKRIGLNRLQEIAPFRSPAKIGWHAYRGLPIYDEAAFRRLLIELLQHEGKRYEKFKQLHIPVLITASDILDFEKKVFGADPDDRTIDRVVDSCALPLVFRTAKVGGTVVDGGLCENLPAEDLIHDPALGQVIAISFDRKPSDPPNSMLTYMGALFSAAMENSVERAATMVGEGRVQRARDRNDSQHGRVAMKPPTSPAWG
jgi:predicted acylesterase/phospholipase RssA